MHDKTISVIMPVLNEEQCLHASVAGVLEGFERHSLNGELIIVNDGSSDRTGAMAEELASRQAAVRALHHATPQGIGASFRDGLPHAHGDVVVYIPGDGEIDASEIFRYVHLMDDVDMVIPYVTNPEVRSWQRRILSSCYHLLMTRTFFVSLKYLNGTVMYRKSILEGITIRNSGYFYQAELLIKAISRNYRYAEVPYMQKPRVHGRSKSITIRALASAMKGYAVMVHEFYFRRSDTFTVEPASITARKQGDI